MIWKAFLLSGLTIIVGLIIVGRVVISERDRYDNEVPLFATGKNESCLSCHEGIEEIHPKSPLYCTTCHLGNPDETEETGAHRGLIKNPADLEVADQTCGTCHAAIVDHVKRSIMATRAGAFSALSYLNGFQEDKEAAQYSFSKVAVTSLPGHRLDLPGVVESLLPFPSYAETKNVLIDISRKACMQCHLWTEGVQRKADYRGTGCAACHMVYATDGVSQSGDPTIPKNRHGHPIRHEITTKIPVSTCATCHAGGNRIGMAYTGRMEQPGRYDVLSQDLEHGHTYSDEIPDIHFEKGMVCIDCHTVTEMHGDGNIYVKKVYQIEIRCETCHGTTEAYGDGITSMENKLSNLRIEHSPEGNEEPVKVILTSKLDSKAHIVPQITMGTKASKARAHQIQPHMTKMECYACHSAWVPKCMGCHIKMDLTVQPNPIHVSFDHLDQKQSDVGLYTLIPGVREAEKDYLLGINHRGKVVPFASRSSVVYTFVNESGEEVYRLRPQMTAKGKLGFAHNPAIPHTVRKETRSCASCHESKKALGLGAARTKDHPKLKGLMKEDFLWDRIVDEEGRPVQETSVERARPFNQEEMDRVRRAVKKAEYSRKSEKQ